MKQYKIEYYTAPVNVIEPTANGPFSHFFFAYSDKARETAERELLKKDQSLIAEMICYARVKEVGRNGWNTIQKNSLEAMLPDKE